MFTKITLENVKGIRGLIELDFVAPPKKKGKKDSVVMLEPNVYVNKVTGIIGSNASGKSSIIKALIELQCFLGQYELLNYAKERNDERMQKALMKHRLPERNFEKLDEKSRINLDVYISKGQKEGYYTYELEYDKDSLTEKLFYRKKFKAKTKFEIENYTSNEQRSDIGYKCYYKDSIIEDYKEVSEKLKESFEEKLKYYKTFYEYFMANYNYILGAREFENITNKDLIEFVENNKDIALKLLNLIDTKIQDVKTKKDEDGETLVKFITHSGTELDIWNLSTGTIRMISIIITTLETIKNNTVMLCDEIETALHKELVELIINMYLKSNRYGQLIYTTHIPEILDHKEMRNEQKYYLTSRNGEIIVKKVSEINPRPDYSISKNYYSDPNYAPQPTNSAIKEFCNYVTNNKE